VNAAHGCATKITHIGGAMPSDITLARNYAVRERDVFLAVTIGDGQQGRSSVLLDNKEILRTSPPFSKFLIGEGAGLVGRTLTIRTVVNDVVATTNRMSVTYALSGGQSSEKFSSKGSAAHDNDFLSFEASFTFVQSET
jgi:hypothetical protein